MGALDAAGVAGAPCRHLATPGTALPAVGASTLRRIGANHESVYDAGMAPPAWLASPALRFAGWAVRTLDRRLAIRVDVDGEEIGQPPEDEWLYVIRIFNGTNDSERILTLQLTFSGGAPPLSVRVPDDAVIDRTHNFETKYDEFIVSAHEDEYRHRTGRTAFFNGVRVRFHSGRDVWRPARGFRPMTLWHRLEWRVRGRFRRMQSAGRAR